MLGFSVKSSSAVSTSVATSSCPVAIPSHNLLAQATADNESAQDARKMVEVSLCPFSEGTLQTVSRSCLSEKVA